jgi:hypothetical protein
MSTNTITIAPITQIEISAGIRNFSGFFERATAALRGDVPKGIRDPAAYKAAVKDAKFTNLVKAVNEWVGTGLDGEARWAAWEVLDAAEKAETRAALTPAARKALDKIVEMYRASSAGMEAAA